MKILFFSHYFYPEGGAAAARLFGHCRRWASDGHEVTVVTCAPNYPAGVLFPGYSNRFRSVEIVEGIRVVRVFTYMGSNRSEFHRSINYVTYMLLAYVQTLCEFRTDVVIATSGHLLCGVTGAALAASLRKPFVLEVRDLWPESVVAVGAVGSRSALRLLERLERYMYRRACHIVTVGDGYREALRSRDVDPKDVSVIMNGVDSELFVPGPPSEEIRSKYNMGGRFVVTYCGTIGLAHGLDVVIRAARLLHERGRTDVLFLLVGDGAQLRALRSDADALPTNNIVFTGAVERATIPAILATSQASLIHLRKSPTFTTVMPSKIFESAAMEIPIILGVEGFAKEFVSDAGCGLCVAPEDEHALVEAVLELADNPGVGPQLGVAGRRYVTGRFDRARLADSYLRILERVLGRESVARETKDGRGVHR